MSVEEGQQADVVIYGTEYCSYCAAARMLLKKKGVNYTDISVADEEKRREMQQKSGGRTVPQIFIDGQPIGGFDELYSLDQSGRLDEILKPRLVGSDASKAKE